MIFDMDQPSIDDGLMPDPDYVFGVQPDQLLPLLATDYIQGSSDSTEDVGGSV